MNDVLLAAFFTAFGAFALLPFGILAYGRLGTTGAKLFRDGLLLLIGASLLTVFAVSLAAREPKVLFAAGVVVTTVFLVIRVPSFVLELRGARRRRGLDLPGGLDEPAE